MNGKSMGDMAKLAAAAQPQPQVDWGNVMQRIFGLSQLAAAGLSPRVEACLCGKCVMGQRLVFDGGVHLLNIVGAGAVPEVIRRTDSPRAPEPAAAPVDTAKVQ
jgi:hypothetical protein